MARIPRYLNTAILMIKQSEEVDMTAIGIIGCSNVLVKGYNIPQAVSIPNY